MRVGGGSKNVNMCIDTGYMYAVTSFWCRAEYTKNQQTKTYFAKDGVAAWLSRRRLLHFRRHRTGLLHLEGSRSYGRAAWPLHVRTTSG